jgi:hypothetical protein
MRLRHPPSIVDDLSDVGPTGPRVKSANAFSKPAVPPAPAHSRRISPVSSSGVAGAPSRRARIRRGRNTLPRRLRRWRKLAWRAWRRLGTAPLPVRIVVIAAAVLAVFAVTNVVYQVVRKPTEMLFPVSGSLNKAPTDTWRQYASLFHEYSTVAITPELLAALAQVEGAGNPAARTYWRWRLTWHPFAIYQPASSAVGMYQMTDPAFAEARRYCVRRHTVVADGAWNDWRSCWFNSLYTRIVPGHAIELTAVFLDRTVAAILARRPDARATAPQTQDLAAIVHLCGAGPARAFAHRGFRPISGERCGDHDVATYLARVNTMKRQFLRLAAEP